MNNKLFSFLNIQKEILMGKISIVELVQNSFHKIKNLEPKIKAFANISENNAIELAIKSEKRYREKKPLSILDGCPFAVKDMINTAKIPTEMNNPFYANWYAPVDAACVNALKAAGAILIGKTVTTPFAVGHTNDTRNPHDYKKTPGGSSSGSGAAVGSGIIPFALGTQTRGSLIRPASFCGAVGFKPTLNSIHMGGIHPLSATLDHVGVIGATVPDTWSALYFMSQVRGGFSGHKPFVNQEIFNKKKQIKKIGIFKFDEWNKSGIDTIKEFEKVTDEIKSYGCEIIFSNDNSKLLNIEKELTYIIENDSIDILAYELDWPYNSYPNEILDDRIIELLDRKKNIRTVDYIKMIEHRNKLIEKVQKLKSNFDFFMTLSSTGPAPEIKESTGSRHYQVPWTYLGFPSISLPLIEVEKMPVGVQILGFGNYDYELALKANIIFELLYNK
ncbi:MAG: putative amidase AmiD [Alphaproteobacteria bacterium MarineAlpha2_Bin1]|nr:MAG: putative amidase AmiD [Alphaproteobacteria bacterium MarineAlpha2_Bin1]